MSQFNCKFILLADSALEDKGGKISIIGIFDRIYTKKLPATHRSAVLVGNFEVLDSSIENVTLNFFLKNEQNEIIGPRDAKLEFDFKGKQNKSANFIIQLQDILFDKEGRYHFHITANSEELCKCYFFVEKTKE